MQQKECGFEKFVGEYEKETDIIFNERTDEYEALPWIKRFDLNPWAVDEPEYYDERLQEADVISQLNDFISFVKTQSRGTLSAFESLEKSASSQSFRENLQALLSNLSDVFLPEIKEQKKEFISFNFDKKTLLIDGKFLLSESDRVSSIHDFIKMMDLYLAELDAKMAEKKPEKTEISE